MVRTFLFCVIGSVRLDVVMEALRLADEHTKDFGHAVDEFANNSIVARVTIWTASVLANFKFIEWERLILGCVHSYEVTVS